jgi:DNA-binding transcriptional MerR regulator
MMYSSNHVCALFGVTRQTVSNWSEEFARHLSPTANPPAGGHRRFTDTDLQIFALVHDLRAAGLTFADAHASLDSGQRGVVSLPDSDALATIEGPAQVALLQKTVSALETKVSDLVGQLHQSETERAEVRGENVLLKAQLKDALDKIDRLNREIGRLEPRIDD